MAFLEWIKYGRAFNTDTWNGHVDQAKPANLARQTASLASQILEGKPQSTASTHHMVLPGNRVIDLIISSRMEDFENNQGLKDLDRLLTTGKGVIAQGLFPSAKAKDGHWFRDIDAVSYTHLRAHETREDRGWRGVG